MRGLRWWGCKSHAGLFSHRAVQFPCENCAVCDACQASGRLAWTPRSPIRPQTAVSVDAPGNMAIAASSILMKSRSGLQTPRLCARPLATARAAARPRPFNSRARSSFGQEHQHVFQRGFINHRCAGRQPPQATLHRGWRHRLSLPDASRFGPLPSQVDGVQGRQQGRRECSLGDQCAMSKPLLHASSTLALRP